MNGDPAPADDLEIRIFRSDRRNGSCPVTILGRNDTTAVGRFRSPFTDAQLHDAILALELGQFDTEPAREFGEALFGALIDADIKTVYDSSGGNAEQTGLRLIVDDPTAARIPWELMFDPVTRTPFATRHRLVRGFSTTTEARPLGVLQRPVRVLVADSSPRGVPRLDSQLEVEDIRAALEPLTASGRIAVDVLSNVTEQKLRNALREGARPTRRPKPVHILHWIGHGGIDKATNNAALLFENEAGWPDTVDGGRLAAILGGSDIRLVFLNACYSAAPTAETARTESSFVVTAGVAEALLVSGIPGVIGMQATIRDDRSRQFARDFYRALADGRTIDTAVLDARVLVKSGVDGKGADIGIPVAYLRAGSTSLLDTRRRTPLGGVVERFGALGAGAKWLVGGVAGTLLSLAVVAVVGLIIPFIQWPPRMNGEFNVIVTEFQATDPAGRPVPDQIAADLSGNLYEALHSGLDELKPDLRVEVMPPSIARRLSGTTPLERSREAEKLAVSANAHMVIYGALDASGTSLQPEFYVSPAFLPGAEELIGVFRLGTPIRSLARPGTPAVGIELRRSLQLRASAVTTFVTGLTFFSARNFSQAEARFKVAIEDAGWADRDGKEVVYLFHGTAAALQGRLEDARKSYQQALDRNPDYGRAMIGLAEVQLHLSSGRCNPGTAIRAGLEAARDQFRAALVARDQPPLSNVPAKAHFGIARVDVCLSQALLEGSWTEAANELLAVIAEFEAGKTTLQDLAAEAHAQLAVVRLPTQGNPNARANYLAAASEYRAAIDLSEDDGRKALFYDGLGWVLERLDQRSDAGGAYDRAIELAPDEAARKVYMEHRRKLDAGASPEASAAA